MTNAILSLDYAGATKTGRAFDVKTRHNRFAGIISETYATGICKVYFNDSCSRGSQRKFRSVAEAVDYIIARRIKKGLSL